MRSIRILVAVGAVGMFAACDDAVPEPLAPQVQALAGTTVVPRGSTWTYWDRGGDLGFDWAGPAYPIASWASGAGPLGYGESYLATTVGYGPSASAKYTTTYFRRQFTVADPAQVTHLLGEVMYDDGFVVYLNGNRIDDDSMPAGMTNGTTHALGHEAGNAYVSYDWTLHRSLLVAGANTIAVEVHQLDGGSSDLVFDLALAVETAAAPPAGEDIARGARWSYWDRGGDQGTAWRAAGFDDAGWAHGAGPLGYGESYLATTIGYGPSASAKYITSYFRDRFTVADPAAVTSMIADVMYDDGAVVYLNGHEIARLAMPAGTITAATLAPGHETGDHYERFDWSAARTFLIAGANVIAVEVHQAAGTSSDLTFDLALDVTSSGAPPPPPAPLGVARGESWKVRVAATAPPYSWRTESFADGDWAELPAPLGYGEPYLRSTISYGGDAAHKYVTTYFRKTFFVSDASQITAMIADVMYDDGVVVWLNGAEVARRGLPATGVPAWSAFAQTHEAGNTYEAIDLTSARGYLHPGQNTIAVEVHQDDAASSDLVFDLGLRLTAAPPPTSIARRSAWTYWDQGGELGTAWRTSSSTAGWDAGSGPLGYGGYYVPTTIDANGVTAYFRRTFHVDDPAAVTDVRGEVMYQDGAVVYVNGHELERLNLPAGPITATTPATGEHAPAQRYQYGLGGGSYDAFDWTAAKAFLVAGENVIAVEVHRSSPTAERLVFDLALQINTAATPRIAGCAPVTPAHSGELSGVWIAPGGAVWAAGSDGVVGRRDAGGVWAWCAVPAADRWIAVWGTADDDVWLVGTGGAVVRWRGDGFVAEDVGTSAELSDVSGSGPDDVFIVGSGGVIRHFDGAAWQVADLPAAHDVRGVWGASAADVWAIANTCYAWQSPDSGYSTCENEVYRWSAATGAFALEATFVEEHGGARVYDIDGSGAGDVWIVGESTQAGAAAGQPFAAHFDGTSWHHVGPPDEPDGVYEYQAVAAGAPGAESGAWLMTFGGGDALRFDGATWSPAGPTTANMSAVDVRGPTMFAAGVGFRVIRWNGAAWVTDD